MIIYDNAIRLRGVSKTVLYDLISFDVRTMIGILFWGNLTSSALIYSYQSIHKNGYDKKSVRLLYLSRLLKSAYYLLVFFRGALPDVISVNLGNSLIFICHYMEGYLMLALSRITSKKPYRLLKGILIGSVILFNLTDILHQNPGLRVAFSSLFMFAILAMPAMILLFSKNNSRFSKVVGSYYVALFLLTLSRAIYSFALQDIFLFTNNLIQSLTFLSFILIMVFGAPAFLLIMKENADAIIEKMANIDGLTSIQNRQSFLSAAHVYFDRHKTIKHEIAVLFMDIDFFKKINDRYGHSFGDEVLVRVADVISNSMRTGDLSCRYGGEEFLALLPDSDEKSALSVGERVMKGIGELHFETYPEFAFTISIGIHTAVPSENSTLETFINNADTALYEAKNTGRNKMVVYCGEVRQQ